MVDCLKLEHQIGDERNGHIGRFEEGLKNAQNANRKLHNGQNTSKCIRHASGSASIENTICAIT